MGDAWEVLACGWAGWADGGADAVGRSGSGQNGKWSRRLRLLVEVLWPPEVWWLAASGPEWKIKWNGGYENE